MKYLHNDPNLPIYDIRNSGCTFTELCDDVTYCIAHNMSNGLTWEKFNHIEGSLINAYQQALRLAVGVKQIMVLLIFRIY